MGKQLVFQVAVGEVPPFYKACIRSVERYCKRHGFDHEVLTEPVLRIKPRNSKRSANALRLGYLPIYEKEVAFDRLKDREAVAVLDADVYVTPTAPSIFGALEGATFGAVLEREMPLTQKYRVKIRKYSEGQFRSLEDVDWRWNEDGAEFANMGVMVFNRDLLAYFDGQSAAEWLARPEFQRFIDGEGHWRWSTDQTLLNWWLKKAGVPFKPLDWHWNALYGAVESARGAYMVHFFLSAKMPQGGAEVPSIIAKW